MPEYKLYLSVYFLRLVATASLSVGFWRWWRNTRRWPFLLLSLCGVFWLTGVGGLNVIGNVADFGKTPEELKTHDVTLLLSRFVVMSYLDGGLMLACVTAGIGLAAGKMPSSAPRSISERPDTTGT